MCDNMAKISIDNFIEKSLTLLEKERTAEINETSVLREQIPLKELQRRGVCLLKLTISNRHTGLYGRTVLQFEPRVDGRELPSHNFTPGDIAGVYLSQGGIHKSDQLCSGIVSRITNKSVSIAFDESHEQLDLDDDSQFKLLKLANDVTYQRVKKALTSLEQHQSLDNRQLIAVLFGESEPGPPYSQARDGKQQDVVFLNPNLDESQREAVQFALKQREVAIIHGPPGTGKTTTVTEIILQAIKQGLKLLVCAPSNIAVDNLVERLARHKARMVRIGHPARVLPSIQNYSLDAVLRSSDEGRLVEDVRRDMDQSLAKMRRTSDRGERQRLREDMKHLRKELRTREEKAFREVLQSMHVVLATLTMATKDGPLKHLKKNHFDLVVIDECSQAMEAACWIALQEAPRCILAGDHNQLPPTILSQEAAKEGLALTLMERLLDLHGNQIMRMLTTQYRMHEDIMVWPSDKLYEGRLTAHDSVAHHLLKDLPGVSNTELTSTALLLVDTAGCDLQEIRLPGEVSKGNEGEADIVTAHVEALVEAGLPPQDIAVIAPYNLQVDLLRLRLSHKYSRLEIKSVDGFQGREKEAVIISLVRSNDKGEVGFLAEDRRINVAITRARRHLAVVCDTDTVGNHDFLKSMVDYLTERGEVKSAQEYVEAGVLNTDIKRPEYIDEQISMQKKHVDNLNKVKTNVSKKPGELKDRKTTHKKHTGAMKSQQPCTEKSGNQKPGNRMESGNCAIAELATDTSEYIRGKLTEFVLDEQSTSFSFPSSLTGMDRKLVHELCENLQLDHVSQGQGAYRHIVVSKPAKSIEDGHTCTEGANDMSRQNSSIGANEGSAAPPVAKEKHPDLSLSPEKSDTSAEKNPKLVTCSICDRDIPLENLELHQLRCKPAPSKPVHSNDENTRPKASKKSKSKAQVKGKKGQEVEDDFDSLIAQAMKNNTSCHFPKCKNSTATLGQNCAFCARRFCLSHHVAESHGCGESARAHARATISREGVIHRGSGVPTKKPDPVKRAHLERRLGNKLDELADKRKPKKKDK